MTKTNDFYYTLTTFIFSLNRKLSETVPLFIFIYNLVVIF